MDLLNLFDSKKEFKRISIRPPRPIPTPSELSDTESQSRLSTSMYTRQKMVSGTDYAKHYIEEENKRAMEAAKLTDKTGGKMDEISVGTVPTQGCEIENAEMAKVYNTFDFEHRHNSNLPIMQHQSEILSTIDTHAVTIIEGLTGCGKSTQVPQFILDHCYKHRKHCNIIVTQPRRIAALSIADRVSRERNWPLGSLVGCQVGMYKNVSKDTRLTYCTTGVLLRKLIKAKNMLDFTHVVLDEVHERDQEMDFLLLVIKKLLRTNSRQVRVVLMSATFNAEKFADYFSMPTELKLVPAPVISVAKKQNYKTHIHYLCQIENLGTIPEINACEPKISEKMMLFCMRLINVFDEIDHGSEYDAEDLAEYDGATPFHSVLIFLPGIWEIEDLHTLMIKSQAASKWDIVILHSSITHDEQRKIFTPPPKGCRRVILSTNIAESSITINDIKYVIDFCLTKQLVTDPATNYRCLELSWASKANCDQRAGRAGRVMDGRVYRLIPKSFYESLAPEGDPEIVRAPLENLVLQTKLLDMGEPKAVLALAIDPPDLSNLERTVLLLKEAGGLLDKPDDINTCDGDLTDLGRIMAALPLEIHLSKLIALGHVFNVLRDTIIMAASMAVKSMFSNPFQKQLEAYCAKVHWADGSTSDCLAFFNAYRVWQREIASNRIKRKSATEKSWANRNFIQIKVLHEVDYLVEELTKRLEQLGIKETMGPNKIVLDDVDRSFIQKIVIAGAFYPNYFVRNYGDNGEIDLTQGIKLLNGLDPTRTVFLQGWSFDQPGKLYAKRIQEAFKDKVPHHEQILVEFDNSLRVYLMLSNDKTYGNEQKQADIPGKISLSVYKALKMRKVDKQIEIPVLPAKQSKQFAQKLKIAPNNCSILFNKERFDDLRAKLPTTLPALPSLEESIIPLKIVYFVDPSKFWAHEFSENTCIKIEKIETFLNDPKNITLKPLNTSPSIGSLVAAKYNDKMYRAIVESFYKIKKEDVANLYFIDYGYRSSSRVTDLKEIKSDHEIYSMRALAFECTLTGIGPSKMKDAKGVWSKEARSLFNSYTQENFSLFGTVYSVVDSVVSLQLSCKNKMNPKDSVILNNLLLKEGLAESVEENYLSKYNHELREKILDCTTIENRKYLEYLQYDKNFLISTYPEPPPLEDCNILIFLKGPFSPLEITLSSLSILGAAKKVNIENGSVNSILLDTNPEDPHDRLLISSLVSQNQTGTNLTLRNTTLMPNIPGLTAILCLIFAPKIELRRSVNGSHYIGALCGLGYEKRTKTSLLPEHDMEVYFDTEISIEDLQNVNRLRHWMNLGICVKDDDNEDLDTQALKCQMKVYDFVRKLTDRPTKSQNPNKLLNFGKWGYYDESLFLLPIKKEMMKEDSIYPLHFALQLEERDEKTEDLIWHMRELRLLSASDVKLQEHIEIYCKLCETDIFGREALRIHLFMKDHREKEKSIGFKP